MDTDTTGGRAGTGMRTRCGTDAIGGRAGRPCTTSERMDRKPSVMITRRSGAMVIGQLLVIARSAARREVCDRLQDIGILANT